LFAIFAIFCYRMVALAVLFCCHGNCTAGFQPVSISQQWNGEAYSK